MKSTFLTVKFYSTPYFGVLGISISTKIIVGSRKFVSSNPSGVLGKVTLVFKIIYLDPELMSLKENFGIFFYL